mgnify:CR=1 FL=1
MNGIQQIRSDFLDQVMIFISWTGNHGTVWILLAVFLLLLKKQRIHGLSTACGLILDLVSCNLTLKPLIGRVRPFVVNPSVELLVAPPLDASFPSGHTAVSFAAVFALKASGSPLWKPTLVWAILMSFSRLYLYVHYPSDVAFSMVLGTLFALIGNALAGLIAPKLGAGKKGKYEA